MKKQNFIIALLICLGLTFIFSSCKKEPNCDCDSDQNVLIGQTEYKNAPVDPGMKILNMEIEGDCLKIKYQTNTCNGGTWIEKFIDRGDLIKTYPAQRTLKLSFDNKELCDMLFEKEISFNIKCLQVKGDKEVQLNIADQSILYKY